jgi:hypothetical protein
VKGTAQFALDVLVNTLTLPKTIVEDFLGDEDDETESGQRNRQ